MAFLRAPAPPSVRDPPSASLRGPIPASLSSSRVDREFTKAFGDEELGVSNKEAGRSLFPLFAQAAHYIEEKFQSLDNSNTDMARRLSLEKRAREEIELKFEAVTKQIMQALEHAERLESEARAHRDTQQKNTLEMLKQELVQKSEQVETRLKGDANRLEAQMRQESQMREQQKNDLINHSTELFKQHQMRMEDMARLPAWHRTGTSRSLPTPTLLRSAPHAATNERTRLRRSPRTTPPARRWSSGWSAT